MAEVDRNMSLVAREYFPEFLYPAYDALQAGETDKAQKLLHKEFRILDGSDRSRNSRQAGEGKMFFLKALILRAKGEEKDSMLALNTAAELHPSSSEILYQQGIMFRSENKPDQALKAFEDALWFNRGNPNISAANLEMAKIYLEKSMPIEAKAALQQALAVNPADTTSLDLLSKLELQAGDKAGALKALRNAVAATPENLNLKLDLAKTLLNGADRTTDQDNIKEANVMIEEVLAKLAASDTPQPTLLRDAKIALIRTEFSLRSVDLADKQLKELLVANPKDPELLKLAKQLAIERSATLPQNISPEAMDSAAQSTANHPAQPAPGQ